MPFKNLRCNAGPQLFLQTLGTLLLPIFCAQPPLTGLCTVQHAQIPGYQTSTNGGSPRHPQHLLPGDIGCELTAGSGWGPLSVLQRPGVTVRPAARSTYQCRVPGWGHSHRDSAAGARTGSPRSPCPAWSGSRGRSRRAAAGPPPVPQGSSSLRSACGIAHPSPSFQQGQQTPETPKHKKQ